jgi:sugar phosphate isomerase/epimerase
VRDERPEFYGIIAGRMRRTRNRARHGRPADRRLKLKLGIDTYCYHRYFGEIYPGIERDPGVRLTLDDVLDRAKRLGVDGVSLESCFFPAIDAGFLARLRDRLDALGFERVWAWGHPSGLKSGSDPEAAEDLVRHFDHAKAVGATVIRICCGGRRTRPATWHEHKSKLLPMLRGIVDAAEDAGVVLAIENHIDFLADELVEVVTTIDSPSLGVCLDTANNLRILEDPMEAIRKLAPFARASHIKDVAAKGGNPREFSFWPSVPLGNGLIDLPAAFRLLREANYDGLLALEIDYLHPAYGEDIDPAVEQSIAYMRGLLAA